MGETPMPRKTLMPRLAIRGRLLNPRHDGRVDYLPDGAIAADEHGVITFVGHARDLPADAAQHVKHLDGLIIPAMLDAHIHIPQHPIRGRFMEGVGPCPAE